MIQKMTGADEMKFNLKSKLLISYVLLISIPILILAFISYSMSSSSMQNTIEQQLNDTTMQTADAIDQTLESAISLLQLMSQDSDLYQTVVNKEDRTLKQTASSYLENVQEDNQGLLEMLIVTDKTGKALLTNESLKTDIDLSDRLYVQEALKGNYAISDVIFSKFTGEPVVAIATPLMKEGEVSGLLIGTVKFHKIAQKVEEVKIGETGYAYMIDKEGLLVSHPVQDKVLKENLSNNQSEELKGLVEEMKAGKTSSGFYTYEGVYKYVTFTPAGNWIVAVTANYDDYMLAANKIKSNSIIITVLSIVIAMAIAYRIAVGITKPVKELQDAMELAGQGDLSVKTEIRTKDEIEELSDSFNRMITNQLSILQQVRVTSDELAASSEEMAASTEEVTSATNEVATNSEHLAKDAEAGNQAVSETSLALLELSSLIQIAKSKATSADEHSQLTLETANDGKETVEDVIRRMEIIKSTTEETKLHILTLEQYSKEITTITDTITNIAQQTNLLALNAAIEAARAGEAGKGFAVVADEVRKLAEQSNDGAAQVSDLIKKVIETTSNTVAATNLSQTEVDEGVVAVKTAGEALNKILSAVHETVNEINEIAEVTENEVATSEKIVDLIHTLSTVIETTASNAEELSASTEETSAAMETIAATTEQISGMAVELRTSINKFKTDNEIA